MVGPFPFLHGTGWRRAAAVNTVFMGILFCALMTAFLFTGKATQSVLGQHFFYTANCSTTNALNLVVHLLLNILSTMILSSSNFFMQVLNAPSRAEVDRIHAKNKSVEIGVPSLRNAFLLKKFKTFSWLVLAATSLPVHLFFNSAIFETDFQGKSWNLTIAAEPFTNNGDFSAPGASLLNPGFDVGYGSPVNVSTYRNTSSTPILTIRQTAAAARNWKRLTPEECRHEYLACKPRRTLKDVVVIVNRRGELNTAGWRRSETFDLTTDDATAWDEIVPAQQLNTLWFAAECDITAVPGDLDDVCTHSCGHALGGRVNLGQDENKQDEQAGNWTIAFQEPGQEGEQELLAFHRSGYRFDQFNNLDVRYCLAQEFEPICKLGTSTLILGLISFTLAIKVAQCLIVLKKVNDDPLVTPGDAVASFLSDPDPATEGMCTLSFTDKRSGCNCCSADRKTSKILTSGPRPWSRSPKYMGAAIPVSSWIRTYTILGISLVLLIYFYASFRARTPSLGTFMHSAKNGRVTDMKFPDGSFLPSLITANKPQVLLSVCYFHYNAIFTRFMAEREWNGYSLSYRPLRVTVPEGAQRATYRLQLPYRFSLPLIALGILLHWMLSNAFYLYIVEGGYYGSDQDARIADQRFGFHPDTIISISYSVQALLALTIMSLVLAMIPVIMSRMKLRGDMVVAGADSRVMSAACHPRPYIREAQTPSVASDIKSPSFFSTIERKDSFRAGHLRSDSRTDSLRTTSRKSVSIKVPSSPYSTEIKSPIPLRGKPKPLSIVPPSPMDFAKTQTASAWGSEERFHPQTGHDNQPPPTPMTPMTPWQQKHEEERLVPLVLPLRIDANPDEQQQPPPRRSRIGGLRIVPPSRTSSSISSHTFDRRLPWIEEKLESPTPISPYPQSAVELKKAPGGTQVLLRLSRRKLRWGAVPLVDRSTSSTYFPEKTMLGFGHLTFGSIESGVVRPEEGKLYE